MFPGKIVAKTLSSFSATFPVRNSQMNYLALAHGIGAWMKHKCLRLRCWVHALAHVAADKRGFFADALTVGVNVQFARLATNVATRQRFGRMTYSVAAIQTWVHS
jgi:hypothetical protein